MVFGYFITYIMALNPYGAFFRFAGYLMMAYGAHKLCEYESRFAWSEYTSLVLSLMSATRILADFTQLISVKLLDALAYADAALVLVYHVLLLLAIRRIAEDTQAEKIQTNSVRNLFFIGIYYLLYVIGMLPTPIKASYEENMGLPILLLNFAWIILDLILLISCYSQICDENDVDMERKPSRFAFVNKMREELDAKKARARESALQYKKEKAERKRKKK